MDNARARPHDVWFPEFVDDVCATATGRLSLPGSTRSIASIGDGNRGLGLAQTRQAAVVKRLPKTRSGKILRGAMRRIAAGETFRPPATIDDPAILREIGQALRALGYPAAS